MRVAGNGNSHARETPVAQWAGRLLYCWLDVRAEQGIPGSMGVPINAVDRQAVGEGTPIPDSQGCACCRRH